MFRKFSIGLGSAADFDDPRVEIGVESLSNCANVIGRLEKELRDLELVFTKIQNEALFENASECARIAQVERHNAIVRFKRANEIHKLARETLAVVERHTLALGSSCKILDATTEDLRLRVINAEHQKKAENVRCYEQMRRLQQARSAMNLLKRKVKVKTEGTMKVDRDELRTLEVQIAERKKKLLAAKKTYSSSLQSLQSISERIHEQLLVFDVLDDSSCDANLPFDSDSESSCKQMLADVTAEHRECPSYSSMNDIDDEIEELRLRVRELYLKVIRVESEARGSCEEEVNAIVEYLKCLSEI